MADDNPSLTRLRSLTRRRQTADARAAEIREQTYAAVIEAYDQGVPKLTLAREAKLTRQTVYTVLLRAGRT